MKKEIFAVALLALMLALSALNIGHLNKLTGEISDLVKLSAENARQENWGKAEENARKALDKWNGSSMYTHIVLRHSDIESVTVAFYELIKEIQNEGAAAGAAEEVCAYMDSIASIEKVRLESVF